MRKLIIATLFITQTALGQWMQLGEANSLPSNEEPITAIGVVDGRFIIGTTENGLYLSEDDGDTWRKPTGTEPPEDTNQMVTVNGRLIAGCSGPGYGVFISTDSGENWTVDSTGLAEDSSPSGNTVLGVANGNIYLSDWQGLKVSTDAGDSWQSAGTGLPPGGSPLDVAGIGSTIFCTWGSGVYKTEDGSTWTRATGAGLPDSNPQLGEIAALNDTLLVYVWNTGLFMSVDLGENWTRIDEMDGDDQTIHDLFVHNGKVYAATAMFVYVSEDNGFTWQEADANFPKPTNMTILGANSSTLLAGKNAAGSGQIWKYELSPTDIADENKSLPGTFSLEQNYPNPFNPSTNIIFGIENNQWVSLKIFNLRGQEIKTLVTESLEAGQHYLQWDGTNNFGQPAPSGLYLYRLETGVKTITRKMHLLR